MNKLFLSLASLFLFVSFARAEMAKDVLGGYAPRWGMAITSSTCNGTGSTFGAIISTATNTELYTISVTSAGTAGSYFQVFDASGSLTPGVDGSTDTARRISSYVSASTVRDIIYNVVTKNGLSMNIITNGVYPCLDIKYNAR